jgi:transposase
VGVSADSANTVAAYGKADPAVLAELAKGRLRAKIPLLREALAGRFRAEHHGLLVTLLATAPVA